MLEVKTCNDQVPYRSHIFGKKGPRLVLPGAVLIQETFQKLCLLNQIGIALTVCITPLVGKRCEGIEGFEKLGSRLFHQGKKFLFGNDLDERFRFQERLSLISDRFRQTEKD